MYEDKFGTPEDPILVPSTEPERIIGVVDPEDDCTIIWAMLKESDPPRQLYENGEYFALIRVDFIRRVGDVLEELEAAPDKQLSK